MMRSGVVLLVSVAELLLTAGTLQAATINTDFTEAALVDTGLGTDIPNPSLASITLDGANDRLVFTTTGNTDMWTSRNNAPIAYILKPTTTDWYMQAEIEYPDSSSSKVMGFTVYADVDGSKPDWTFGLDNWAGQSGGLINLQGLADNNPLIRIGTTAQHVILRLEVQEGAGAGGTNHYTAKYDLLDGSGMQTLGTYDSGFDNSRAGIFLKSSTGRTGYFDSLTIVPRADDPGDACPRRPGRPAWEETPLTRQRVRAEAVSVLCRDQ